MEELDVRLAIHPGHSFHGSAGFQPLVHVRGLSLANKQINKELMSTLFSKNDFLLSVDEIHPYWIPGQFLRSIMAPAHLAQIDHLHIDVETKLQPFEEDYHKGIIVVKESMNHIVETLNSIGNGLKSLTINHISCYDGEIEELRRDADIVAARNDVRKIQAMRADRDVQELDTKGIDDFFLHSNNIADATGKLVVPVQKSRILGDVSGKDVKRLYHKFGIVDEEVDEHKEHRDKNGQRRDVLELMMEGVSNAHPDMQDAAAQARRYAKRPVMTTRVGLLDGRDAIMIGDTPIAFPFGGRLPTVHPPR